MLFFVKLMLMLVIGFFSINSFAMVDAQLLLGMTQNKVDLSEGDRTCNSLDIKAAVHVDPLPLVPIAFGVFLLNQSYDIDADAKYFNYDKFYGMQLGPEVMMWMPVPFYDFKIYGKLGYALYGAYQGKYSYTYLQQSYNLSMYYEQKGLHLSAGLKWDPLMLVKGLFEINIYKTQLKETKTKINDEEININDINPNYNPDADIFTYGFFIGIEVGI